MRTKPLLGQKAWFGPRRFGWGLGPVSVEGWVVTAVAVAAVIVLVTTLHRLHWVGLVPLILLLVVSFLKGTSPGGPQQWDEFQASKTRTDQ
jgi:hypothetical protein